LFLLSSELVLSGFALITIGGVRLLDSPLLPLFTHVFVFWDFPEFACERFS
uniref:Transmembrane protein n=1 Tax=Haemonchus placei TaxID=6290 RepID=A0A0N4WFD7_HAEPC